MKGHVPSNRPADHERRLLNQAARAPVTEGHAMAPATLASMIATGKITREMCCDGKKRYRTWEFVEEIRAILEKRYSKTFIAYACCFCSAFHLASENEVAA